MSSNTITIQNKKIYDFYTSNPTINIEAMNLLLIKFIEEMGTDMSKMLYNTIQGEILNNVKEIKQELNQISTNLSSKIQQHNKDFIENIKLIMSVTSTENTEKIALLLNKNIDSFMERLSFTLPNIQDETNKKIQDNLDRFQKLINDDIRNFLYNNHSDKNLKDFISTLEHKMHLSQQPIFSIINSNQELVKTNINSLKEDYSKIQIVNDRLYTELSDFLSRYKSSSQYKGQVSEFVMEELINRLYPTGEILNTSSQTACCDLLLKRENKPKILLENKNYKRNVDLDEIKKFLRDIAENKSCGIMLSQHSGIVGKPDYFIEVHDGNVIVYLHNVEYSGEKIKTAVDIIDNLYDKLSVITSKESQQGITIKKECLDKINEEYQFFIAHKETVCNTVRDMSKKLLSQLEDLKMPELSDYLKDKYASVQNQEFICDVCNTAFSNKRALASHKKLHKTKKEQNIVVHTD
jgi:hypothetical protein